MSNLFYRGTISLFLDYGDIDVDVQAEASGFYSAGDSFGYGCEPPDGDFEIDSIEYIKAYDPYSNEPVEITEEIKKEVQKKLYENEEYFL